MIKQIGLPLRSRPILLITRMITDRIGLHSVLLPLHINSDFVWLWKVSWMISGGRQGPIISPIAKSCSQWPRAIVHNSYLTLGEGMANR